MTDKGTKMSNGNGTVKWIAVVLAAMSISYGVGREISMISNMELKELQNEVKAINAKLGDRIEQAARDHTRYDAYGQEIDELKKKVSKL
jgi:hypothetical protein